MLDLTLVGFCKFLTKIWLNLAFFFIFFFNFWPKLFWNNGLTTPCVFFLFFLTEIQLLYLLLVIFFFKFLTEIKFWNYPKCFFQSASDEILNNFLLIWFTLTWQVLLWNLFDCNILFLWHGFLLYVQVHVNTIFILYVITVFCTLYHC